MRARPSLTCSHPPPRPATMPSVPSLGQRDRPSHTSSFLFEHLGRQQAAVVSQPGNREAPGSRGVEENIAAVRRSAMEGHMNSLEQEMVSLEVAVGKLREQPTLAGTKHVRQRKAELQKSNLLNTSLLENVLSVSADLVERSATKAHSSAKHSAVLS